MLPLVFLGGVVVGAAGLAAAALYDSRKTEAQYSPELRTPGMLDADGVVRELNNYFFKAQKLYSECNEVVFDCAELLATPVELPGDGVIQKGLNRLGSGMNGMGRRINHGRLRDLEDEAARLYGRYRGVFARGNELVRELGHAPISLDGIKFDDVSPVLDNSIENENWDMEIEALADGIRESLDKSCDIANQLIDRLQSGGKPLALEPHARGK